MKVKCWISIFVLLLLPAIFSGCGRNDQISRAIRKLNGSPAERKQASMMLKLTSRDPVPALIAAVENSGNKVRLRAAAVVVLGEIAKRQDDKRSLSFLARMLESEELLIQEAAVKGLGGTKYEDAVVPLIRLRRRVDDKLRARIEKTIEGITREMVKKIERMWSSPDATRAEYSRLEKTGITRGLTGLSKARFLDLRGRRVEAGALDDDLGVVRRWWLIGPFPSKQDSGFSKVFPPEHDLSLTNTYWSGFDHIAWYRMDSDANHGNVDFTHFFVETQLSIAYALIFAISEEDQPIEIRAGSDDTLTIFLNGECVWENESFRGVRRDDDVAPVILRKGVNTVLFKIWNDWGGWGLFARFTGPCDTPLSGVELTLDPPDENTGPAR